MAKYSELEIVCGKPGKLTTGLDTEYTLNGENLKKTHGVKRFEWKVTPDKSMLIIKTRDGKRITTKRPVKAIMIHTKYLSIVSDNTSIGTRFYHNGKDITQDLAVIELNYVCGKSDEINELELIVG